MAFRHGVYKSEVPTSLVSPVQGEAGLPVVIGASPVYMASLPDRQVNKPVLCYTYGEAVQALGFTHHDWGDWTLCEFMYSQFALYGQSPCVLINVFDPAAHREAVSSELHEVTGGEVNLGRGVMIYAGITVKDSEGEDIAGLQSEGNYDDDGNAILTLTGANIPASVKISYVKAKPSMITASDIIGGVNASTGKVRGLELVNEIYPRFRLIPGMILAPKWSMDSTVAAVMRAKASNINGLFTCISLADIPSGEGGAKTYTEVPEWKSKHNYVSTREVACWPKLKLGDDVFHMSTQLAGLMNATDSDHGDVPYKSPSNENIQADGCVNEAGDEIALGHEQATYLNSQGICTAMNFASGWVFWGNRTAAYPGNTDPKDAFIPIRRMFDYIGNTFITTFMQKTDEPMTPALLRTIIDTFNVWLNGLAARGMILGGRIEFNENENPLTDLMDGIMKFHISVTPPPPAEVIEGILEFDPAYFSELAGALN